MFYRLNPSNHSADVDGFAYRAKEDLEEERSRDPRGGALRTRTDYQRAALGFANMRGDNCGTKPLNFEGSRFSAKAREDR